MIFLSSLNAASTGHWGNYYRSEIIIVLKCPAASGICSLFLKAWQTREVDWGSMGSLLCTPESVKKAWLWPKSCIEYKLGFSRPVCPWWAFASTSPADKKEVSYRNILQLPEQNVLKGSDSPFSAVQWNCSCLKSPNRFRLEWCPVKKV